MTDAIGSFDTALDFLQKFRPDGPWMITAIIPDGKTETQTFNPTSKNFRAWFNKNLGKKNMYFLVNPVRTDIKVDARKKTSKTDMGAMEWLYVDMDPRAGEDFEEERARIREVIKNAEIPPTIVIDSGNGYQLFWRLVRGQELIIDGVKARWLTLEAYNKQLEKEYGADNCHNSDRIMRVPGTINLPTLRKRTIGRVECVSSLVSFDNELVYPLSSFTPAVQVQSGPALAGSSPRIVISGNTPPMGTEELAEWALANGKTIKDTTLAIIATGTDPLGTGYVSRSEPLFKVCCDLQRAEVPEEVIFAVITGPNAIAESVLEKADSEGYALRQIERSREAVDDGPVVFSSYEPATIAQRYRQKMAQTLLRHSGDWLEYDAAAYREVEEETLRSRLYAFLGQTFIWDAKSETAKPFNPTKTKVSDVLDALKGITHRPTAELSPPDWLEDHDLPANEFIACQNGLLHLTSGKLHHSTPDFYTRNALDVEYQSDAPTPVGWLKFLDSIWPNGNESISTLQDIFGYLLIPDTSLQKIFLMVGPPRSGKGTIAHILESLVGRGNTCAPKATNLSSTFGQQPLIGKQLALMPDLRFGRMTDHAALAETFLNISGEDSVTIDRKYQAAWNGRLSVRFFIMTNELPKFSDAGGALPNRFVPLMMHRSFLHQEDVNLKTKLLGELPGILNWAIEGWRRLHKRGHFILPQESKEAVDSLTDLSSPESAFVREMCKLEPEADTAKDELYGAFKTWCQDNGYYAEAKAGFSANLYAATHQKVSSCKPVKAGKQVPSFKGIRLLSAVPVQKDEVSCQCELITTKKPPF